MEDSTRQDLPPVGRKRSKKGSNAEGRGPADPKERIKKVTDGSTHPAYAAEHAMATESGAIICVTIQDATAGEPTTRRTTMQRAMENLCAVLEDPERDAGRRPGVTTPWIADEGDHVMGTHENTRTSCSLETRSRWSSSAHNRPAKPLATCDSSRKPGAEEARPGDPRRPRRPGRRRGRGRAGYSPAPRPAQTSAPRPSPRSRRRLEDRGAAEVARARLLADRQPVLVRRHDAPEPLGGGRRRRRDLGGLAGGRGERGGEQGEHGRGPRGTSGRPKHRRAAPDRALATGRQRRRFQPRRAPRIPRPNMDLLTRGAIQQGDPRPSP